MSATSAAPAPTVKTAGRPRSARKRFGWISVRLVILALVIVWMIPLVGLLVTSFREETAIRSTAWWTALLHPFDDMGWSLSAYEKGIKEFGPAIATTIAVVVPAVIMPVLFAAYAAYGLTFLKFRGRVVLFALFVSMLMIPLQSAFIPLLKLWLALGLKGSWVSIWITHSAFGTPMAIAILYGFISRLPRELIEAARSDGASHFQVFWHVVLPLASPAITAYAVFQFLWTWNDMLVALVFLTSDKTVVNVALMTILTRYGTNWQALSAGAFLTMIVPVLVFFFMQRYVVRGLMRGAVKG